MTVRFSCKSSARRSFFCLRFTGRKPSNTQREVSCPETASAVTQAEAAGMGTTLMPRASASRTMTSPGSDTQGMPASLHKAQLSPASMRCKMASPFCKACS